MGAGRIGEFVLNVLNSSRYVARGQGIRLDGDYVGVCYFQVWASFEILRWRLVSRRLRQAVPQSEGQIEAREREVQAAKEDFFKIGF